MYRIPCIKLHLVRDGSVPSTVRTISSSEAAYTLLQPYFAHHDREEFVVLCLDAKHHITGLHTVSIGSLSLTIVHPRECYKAAILSNASAIILAHNHPSGDRTPSAEDRTLTARLKEAGTLLGVPVLDHLIITDSGYYSFADSNAL